jgi:hypothetical protein
VEAPAVPTIHQALRRNGLVATGPRRRAKADKRFEREVSNDLWQIDATQILCDDGTKGWGINLLDDHSQYLLAAQAGPAATGELAWDVFELAASRYGLPRQVRGCLPLGRRLQRGGRGGRSWGRRRRGR